MAIAATASPQRATQGFVANVTWAWQHPAAVLLEIGWRWMFGAPALWLIWTQLSRILDGVPWQATGVGNVSANQLLTDPMRAAATVGTFASLVWPGVLAAARWLAPLLLLAWIVISALGRTLLLRRIDRSLRPRVGTLLGVQAVRVVLSVGVAALWWIGVQWVARVTIADPIAAGGEPQMMLYTGGAIALTLGMFVLTGALSWVFAAAPIVAMRDNAGVLTSLRRAAGAHGARGGMVEINLVLSVVKIMLIVLAMAFSAFPLPFTTIVTQQYVLIWSALVGLWYFAASDFFHVTRLHAFDTLLRRRQLTPAADAASE